VELPQVVIEKNKAMITISVKEGPRTLIDKVKITGASTASLEEMQKAIKLKGGDPYNEVDIADARSRLADIFFEKGFLDVQINARVEFTSEGAQLTFEVQEGEKTFFGKTIITGNVSTKREVIERELLHKEAEPFNSALLTKERLKLYKLGLFTEVRIEGLDRYDHQRDIRIDVVEGDAGSVDFGFGYSNYEQFTVIVDVGYKNLFGMNRQVSLRLGYNLLERLYSLNYYDPWFLDRQLQLKDTVFYTDKEEKNIDTGVILYRDRKYGFSFGVAKQYTDTVKGEVAYEYVLADTYDVQPDMILTGDDTGKITIASLKPAITYDTRDNPFDPRNGVLVGLTMKLASSAFFSQVNFDKVIFNSSLYHEISKTCVLAAAFRLGVAQGFGPSTILPLVERFFLGGRTTNRGYAQDTLGPRGALGDPTGGNAFVETNLELRTALGKGIGLVTFLDSGNVWQKVGDMDLSLRSSAGLGLRYDTPVGPIRLDYGYKLKREEGLSRGELFFSIGQAF
jgi:outer membrane protein insertion porin family